MHHYFFITEKQTFNVKGTDYDAWIIGSRYYTEAGDPRPEGSESYNITALLASAGGEDMLYVYESSSLLASAIDQPEYAGGGTTYGNAWLDFTVRSYERVGKHWDFPAGSAAKTVLPCRWVNSGEVVSGTVKDWITAGKPEMSNIGVGHRVFGAE